MSTPSRGSDSKTSGTTKSGQDLKTSGKSETKSKVCHPDCPTGVDPNPMPCSPFACNFDIDKDPLTCVVPVCPTRLELPPSPADSDVEIQFEEIHNMCCVKSCDTATKVKDFIADGVSRKKITKEIDGDDPCFCDCVCTFRFSNKTSYCPVCGGYECLGDDMRYQPAHIKPHPCPVYHKLYDKKYIKVESAWPEEEQYETLSTKSSKAVRPKLTKSTTDKKNKEITSEEKPKKSVDLKKEDKPQEGAEEDKANKGEDDKKKKKKSKKSLIGSVVAKVPVKKEDLKKKYHYPPVPRNMGWNWLAEDIPGMKIRPNWKPGAANAILVRRYRAQRGEGEDSLKKKKRNALLQRKKKIEMKPTLIVSKRDGEYTVQMEVFKKFSKERLLFQYPYDEKPPLMYTIGKTAEEVRKIQRQRDRRERRETRRKSRLLQSSFRDRCQEICLKAYNQAIGVLPLPDPNSPDCPCAGDPIHVEPPIVDSCSCSDDASTIETSDTDNDEWVIEFTPPSARWDAKAKHPHIMHENETQYTYLDYKVKIVDKSGNQVPRFFKGPDGKQECSDLGGFWSMVNNVKTWLEINKDGYVGPDERWVPQSFTGPDGMLYSSDDGVFTDNLLRVWKIGVDGYVDSDGKWAFYTKKKAPGSPSKHTKSTVSTDGKRGAKVIQKVSPTKAKTGDSKDKKDAATTKKETHTVKSNNKVKIKTAHITKHPQVPKLTKNTENVMKSSRNEKTKPPIVVNVSTNFERRRIPRISRVDYKPYMNQKAIAKYREMIEELRAYDDIREIKPPAKASRASNTPLSQLSNFTMQARMLSKMMPSFSTDMSYGFGTSTTMSGAESHLTGKLNTDDNVN